MVKSMCLHAAHDCNLRCKYCFAATGDFCMGERKLLPYEVGKAAMDWLVEHSGKRVNLELDFFGGEPLMNFPVVKRLVEYGRTIEKEKNKHFKFTITTNCVLMTDEIMDFLNKEMSNVVISIDGRRKCTTGCARPSTARAAMSSSATRPRASSENARREGNTTSAARSPATTRISATMCFIWRIRALTRSPWSLW